MARGIGMEEREQAAAARGFYFALCCLIIFWFLDTASSAGCLACTAGGMYLSLEPWIVSLAQYVVGFSTIIAKIGVVAFAIRLACTTPQTAPFWLWPIVIVCGGLLVLPVRMFLPMAQSLLLARYASSAALADAYFASTIRYSIVSWTNNLMHLGLVLFAFIWWWRAATVDPNRQMASNS